MLCFEKAGLNFLSSVVLQAEPASGLLGEFSLLSLLKSWKLKLSADCWPYCSLGASLTLVGETSLGKTAKGKVRDAASCCVIKLSWPTTSCVGEHRKKNSGEIFLFFLARRRNILPGRKSVVPECVCPGEWLHPDVRANTEKHQRGVFWLSHLPRQQIFCQCLAVMLYV